MTVFYYHENTLEDINTGPPPICCQGGGGQGRFVPNQIVLRPNFVALLNFQAFRLLDFSTFKLLDF